MKRTAPLFFLLFFLLLVKTPIARAEAFRYGLDVLNAQKCAQLQGKRVGLITNAAAVSRSGEPGYRVFLRNGVDLKFLMAPEHGFALDYEAGEKVDNAGVGDSLKVWSLYGESRKPDVQLLKTIDVLVFDLQDAGVRCYTYISTMNLAMEACYEAGITFMVLDRPNPIAPIPASGFVLEPGFESFVGAAELPLIHGMSVGEIAGWLKKRYYPALSLQIVRMQGYRRDRFADELSGFRFRPPSPNLRDFKTLLLYPATVMLEGTDVSEGRGTDAPFRVFGAPFIDSNVLIGELEQYRLPGVEFHQTSFTPERSKFCGVECQGVRLKVSDRRLFDPFMTSTAILLSLQKLWPEQTGLERHAEFFDKLAGTDRYRRMIQQQRPIGEILEVTRRQTTAFDAASPERFLYP
ncbi:MAG: exo-beta-N-acetylmuramidase NamZ family protein [Chlorobaculum sp.]